jgi:pantothenate kinase type III
LNTMEKGTMAKETMAKEIPTGICVLPGELCNGGTYAIPGELCNRGTHTESKKPCNHGMCVASVELSDQRPCMTPVQLSDQRPCLTLVQLSDRGPCITPVELSDRGPCEISSVLAVDIGNTNTVYALFENGRIAFTARIATCAEKTTDDIALYISGIFAMHRKNIEDVDGFAISSVVPRAFNSLMAAIKCLSGQVSGIKSSPKPDQKSNWKSGQKISMKSAQKSVIKIVIAGPDTSGLEMKVDSPERVGADRIVNAAGALWKHGCIVKEKPLTLEKPIIIVDLGTATTVSVLDRSGAFIGGCICPGVMTSAKALSSAAAQLPDIDLFNTDYTENADNTYNTDNTDNTDHMDNSGNTYNVDITGNNEISCNTKNNAGDTGIRIVNSDNSDNSDNTDNTEFKTGNAETNTSNTCLNKGDAGNETNNTEINSSNTGIIVGSIIAKNTKDCMRAGIVYGTASMLDGIIERMEDELGTNAKVIATGGLAHAIIGYCKKSIIYEPNLLLEGLYRIYTLNSIQGGA